MWRRVIVFAASAADEWLLSTLKAQVGRAMPGFGSALGRFVKRVSEERERDGTVQVTERIQLPRGSLHL